jgi:hypothetical protein
MPSAHITNYRLAEAGTDLARWKRNPYYPEIDCRGQPGSQGAAVSTTLFAAVGTVAAHARRTAAGDPCAEALRGRERPSSP